MFTFARWKRVASMTKRIPRWSPQNGTTNTAASARDPSTTASVNIDTGGVSSTIWSYWLRQRRIRSAIFVEGTVSCGICRCDSLRGGPLDKAFLRSRTTACSSRRRRPGWRSIPGQSELSKALSYAVRGCPRRLHSTSRTFAPCWASTVAQLIAVRVSPSEGIELAMANTWGDFPANGSKREVRRCLRKRSAACECGTSEGNQAKLTGTFGGGQFLDLAPYVKFWRIWGITANNGERRPHFQLLRWF